MREEDPLGAVFDTFLSGEHPQYTPSGSALFRLFYRRAGVEHRPLKCGRACAESF